MFSINIYLRFALIGLFLGGGIVLALVYGFWYSFPFLLIGLIFILGYIFLGTVQSAAQLMQNMDFLGAEKRLGLTIKPNWLYKANRAYFYMIKGSIAMQFKRNDEAEEFLQRSKSIGLASDNEKAMVLLQLANLAVIKNNWQQAKIYFRETKQQKVTEPQLKEQIVQFEKAMKNQGAMRVSQHRHRGSMMQPGGKRRRPKAR